MPKKAEDASCKPFVFSREGSSNKPCADGIAALADLNQGWWFSATFDVARSRGQY